MSAPGVNVVGREQELAAVRAFVSTISGPSALVVEGDPGIGKTTLWDQGLGAASASGARVLRCRAADAETEFAFAALTDLLGDVAAEALAELPGPQRHALEVALLLAEPGDDHPDRRAVAAAALGVLRVLAREQPVVVGVDDAHWLDAATRSVLAFAARRLRDEAVGFLVARRSDGDRGSLDLDRAFGDGRFRRIALDGLDVVALTRLLAARQGVSLTRPALLRISEASGGNPLYALELARAVADGAIHLAPGEPLPVPESLHELIDGRLRALPPAVMRTLRIVAALGDAPPSLLPALGVSASALDAAVATGVLERDADHMRFSHPLVASAVYTALDPAARRRLHSRLAGVVSDPEQQARQLALAADHPSEAVAAALDRAAGRADARGAPAAAAALSERARELTPADGTARGVARAVQAAQYHLAAGDSSRARELLQEVLADTWHGPLRAEALWWLGTVSYREGGWRDAACLFEDAARETGATPRLRALALCDLAWVEHMAGGSEEAALAYATEALELARGSGDRGVESRAAAMVAVHDLLAHGVLRTPLLEHALALEDPSDPWPAERRPSFIAASILSWTGDLEGSRARLEALAAMARERGDEGSIPLLLAQLAAVECRRGDWRRAREVADEAEVVAVQTREDAMRPATLGVQALVDAYAGDRVRARERAEHGLALAVAAGIAPGIGFNVAVLGFLDLSEGDHLAAAERLGELAAALVAADLPDLGASQVVPNAIEALIGLGRLDEAEELLVPLEAQTGALTGALQRATRARCRGMLQGARGDLPGAIQVLELALGEHDGIREPFERARTLLALGTMQRRAKQRRAARDSLEGALKAFEHLGAPLWADKARAELGSIGGRAPASGRLTATERRVAKLVAQGRSNKEVAAELFVTPRTVEGHLTRIYGKLGLRSRAQLAHRLAERRDASEQSQGVSGV